MPQDFFAPVVPDGRRHPHFRELAQNAGYAPARELIRELSRGFADPDGNFVEQFQTTGFDARIWELYWHAYLTDAGFEIDRTNPSPDFMIARHWITAALEVVTVNPTQGDRVVPPLPNPMRDEFDSEAIAQAHANHLPIKFAGALTSKLSRRYWELPHVAGVPLIFAIQAFHDEGALFFSSAALTQYLYGQRATIDFDAKGKPILGTEPIATHSSGTKVIPSGFFTLPGSEFVSAVVFSNAGTIAKFNRMGHQGSYRAECVRMIRSGVRLHPERYAVEPVRFVYEVGDGSHAERWGEELVVLHNPNARHPLPLTVFPDAHPIAPHGAGPMPPRGFHPLSSATHIVVAGEGRAA